ncbi:MAG: tRNA 4-thiouridine(8) synthase ThiI [Planctomycetes bacterium]|nr:tRNA 4-thiouridine(8) synthase ThiI [Planctomycetota bacterium]
MDPGTPEPARANSRPPQAAGGALIVRYHEIGLKGGNRGFFERKLCENLRAALPGVPELRTERIRGRVLVRAGVPAERLLEPVSRVFGVASLSPAVEVEADLDQIAAAGRVELRQALSLQFAGREAVRFRVKVNRADKGFPKRSNQIERELAEAVMPEFPALQVNLGSPELSLEVDLRQEGTWVFARRIPGPGGLPVGVMGRVVCLLSGGIDSPVAAWLAMKRGMRVDFVSFYSFPHVGPQLREKLIRQVENLNRWQPTAKLTIVPFTPIQEAIRDSCPPSYRTVLYRRAMQRIASKIAFRSNAKALITGESVGQVASQTLENMTVIEAASALPVLRPLVTMDKHETVALARRIGSYETSNLPVPDCCTVFQPDHPVIYGRLDEALAAEEPLDLAAMTAEAVRGSERLRFPE